MRLMILDQNRLFLVCEDALLTVSHIVWFAAGRAVCDPLLHAKDSGGLFPGDGTSGPRWDARGLYHVLFLRRQGEVGRYDHEVRLLLMGSQNEE